ncbi:MAG: TrmH family RNA methyltransferase [Acidimicrobiia bacterium]
MTEHDRDTEAGLSHRNPRVAETARLHGIAERRRRGLTLLEGPHLVEEAVDAGVGLGEIYARPGDTAASRWAAQTGVELILVRGEALKRLSSTSTPQSPVAVMPIPERPLDPNRSVLVAWQISDPGNLGTMIRTAAAFGLEVAATAGSADLWSPKTLRAAAGGHFKTGVAEIADLAEIEALTVAAVVRGGSPPKSLPVGRLALLIGSEANGLPEDVAARADLRVTIPMMGNVESLNAAAVAAILCFEVGARASENPV